MDMGFTRAIKKQVYDCVVEGRVKRLTRIETRTLIKSKVHIDVSMRHIDGIIKTLKKQAPARLKELQESRFAFLDEVFKSLDEVDRLIQESWNIYRKNPTEAQLQLNCIRELHQLTITRSNIIDILPAYGGMKPINNGGSEKEAIPSNLVSTQQRGNSQAVF